MGFKGSTVFPPRMPAKSVAIFSEATQRFSAGPRYTNEVLCFEYLPWDPDALGISISSRLAWQH